MGPYDCADARQLVCGCWVPLEHTGPCARHGEKEGLLCPQCGPDVAADEDGCCTMCGATTCSIAYVRRWLGMGFAAPTWLDEVAKDIAQGMYASRAQVNLADVSPEFIAVCAYNAAQALLDEGRKRREARHG